MKKLLIFLLPTLVIISFFTSCSTNKNEYEYVEEEWLSVPFVFGEYIYDDAKPLIRDFNGEKFASRNITADGYYSGYQSLSANGDVIYCEDDGSIIWCNAQDPFSSESGSPWNGIMRLKRDGTAERICVVEECRNNLDADCTHMDTSIQKNLRYSDGILYILAHNNHSIEEAGGSDDGIEYSETVDHYDENRYDGESKGEDFRSYILMYDFKTHKMQKLIDAGFPDDGEQWGFGFANINGRYVYLSHGLLYGGEDKIIRVDLYDENASIVIYDYMSLEKVGDANNLRFYKENIYTADKNTIYRWDLDMTSCTPIVHYEDGSVIFKQIYNDALYYFKYPTNADTGKTQYELYRYDLKILGETEPVLLHDSIRDMYIDNDILYYSPYSEYDAFVYFGINPEKDERERAHISDIITHRVYNGNEILAVPLDLARPSGNWSGMYGAYTPQGNDILGESGFFVKNGYIYTDIYVERQDPTDSAKLRRYRASVRVKPISNRTDYIFYEEYTPFEMYKTE